MSCDLLLKANNYERSLGSNIKLVLSLRRAGVSRSRPDAQTFALPDHEEKRGVYDETHHCHNDSSVLQPIVIDPWPRIASQSAELSNTEKGNHNEDPEEGLLTQ